MPTDKTNITDLVARQAKPRDKRYEIADASRTGFRLSVQTTGAKSFILRYSFKGEYLCMTLGKYVPGGDAFKIALAAFTAAQDALARGDDPKGIRRTKGDAAGAVAAAIELFREKHVSTLRPNTQDYVVRSLTRLAAEFDGRQMRSIAKSELVRWLDKITSKLGASAGVSHWKVTRCFFRWYESREDDFQNPARVIERPAAEKSRDRVLSDAELRAVWNAAVRVNGATGHLTRLLILTGCRRHEITDLERKEVGDDAITLPASRTKNECEHVIPLTAAMRAVLRECPKDGPFAINGAHKLGDHSGAKAKLDAVAKIASWTFHDLRRSVATGMQKLGIAPHIVELCLNHKSGTFRGVAGIYQRHKYTNEIAAAFKLWSEHIEAIASGAKIKAAA
jgi:integrase